MTALLVVGVLAVVPSSAPDTTYQQQAAGLMQSVEEWISGEQLAEWVAGEVAQAEADRRLRAQLESAARAYPRIEALPSGDCANPVVSDQIAWRESRCRWDAYSATGCGGRGCIGFYQLDAGHFAAVSPWNRNVSGSCYGLDPSTPDGQTECASRLGAGAWR